MPFIITIMMWRLLFFDAMIFDYFCFSLTLWRGYASRGAGAQSSQVRRWLIHLDATQTFGCGAHFIFFYCRCSYISIVFDTNVLLFAYYQVQWRTLYCFTNTCVTWNGRLRLFITLLTTGVTLEWVQTPKILDWYLNFMLYTHLMLFNSKISNYFSIFWKTTPKNF